MRSGFQTREEGRKKAKEGRTVKEKIEVGKEEGGRKGGRKEGKKEERLHKHSQLPAVDSV